MRHPSKTPSIETEIEQPAFSNESKITRASRLAMRLTLIASLIAPSACAPTLAGTRQADQQQVVQVGGTNMQVSDKQVSYLDSEKGKDAIKAAMLTAVKENGLALSDADDSLKKDKEVVLAAVKEDGTALQYADDSLKKDKEVVMAAVKEDGTALQYADDSLRKDKNFILAMVKINGWVLQYADDSLKKDRNFVLAAVKEDGRALNFADDSFGKDKEVVMAAVKEDGRALQCADDSLKKDRNFVLAAVKENGWALQYADDSFEKDKEVIMAAVKEDGRTLQLADDSLKKDRNFVLAAVKENGWALQYADESIRRDEQLLRAYLESKTDEQKVDKLIRGLKKHDIKYPERFSVETLERVIQERDRITEPNKKHLALAVYSRQDWNHALTKNNPVRELIDSGFQTLYFEASSEDEVYDAIKATEATRTKISVLVLGAHGSSESMAFGSNDPKFAGNDYEKQQIDIGDKTDLEKYRDRLSNHSTIILDACSTGEGGKNSRNVANTLHNAFPQAKIFSSTIPSGLAKIQFDQNGAIIGAYFSNNANYIIEPNAIYGK